MPECVKTLFRPIWTIVAVTRTQYLLLLSLVVVFAFVFVLVLVFVLVSVLFCLLVSRIMLVITA